MGMNALAGLPFLALTSLASASYMPANPLPCITRTALPS
jgi:hypothetical protein